MTLALAGGAAKSSIKKREEHPVWDERFALPAEDPAAPLLVTLLDWEMTHADRVVGQLLVQVQDVVDAGDGCSPTQRAPAWIAQRP